MLFVSKAQQRAASGGYLGSEMKTKADEWAKDTPDLAALPEHVKTKPGEKRRKLRIRRAKS